MPHCLIYQGGQAHFLINRYVIMQESFSHGKSRQFLCHLQLHCIFHAVTEQGEQHCLRPQVP